MAEKSMLEGLRNSCVVILSLVPESVVEYYGGAMRVGRSEK
jgi:hypothetical protein